MSEVEILEKDEAGVIDIPIKYNITNAAIAAMVTDYSSLEISDAKSYEAVRLALGEVRSKRTAVEKKRKELKARALGYGRRVDSEAKRITTLLLEIEEPLKEKKQAEDDKQNEAKRETERAEAERVEKIQSKIEGIRSVVPKIPTSSDQLKSIMDTVEQTKITPEIFQEFAEEAEEVKMDVIISLGKMNQERVKWEDEERKRKEEIDEIKKLRAEQEKAGQERKVREAKEEAAKQVEERARQAERDKIEDEKRALIAEKTRFEEEKKAGERERQENLCRQRVSMLDGPVRVVIHAEDDPNKGGGRIIDTETGETIMDHKSVLSLSDEEFNVLADNYNSSMIARRKEAEAKALREQEEFERITKEKLERETREKIEQEERERKEKEVADEVERRRQEALRPDRGKLLLFSDKLLEIPIPSLSGEAPQEILNEALKMIRDISAFIRAEVENI